MSERDRRPVDRHRPLLSKRRVEMLVHVANGRGNKEIAVAMGCSLATIKTQMRLTCRRLGAQDRAHAVAIALRMRIVHFSDIAVPAPDPPRFRSVRPTEAAR